MILTAFSGALFSGAIFSDVVAAFWNVDKFKVEVENLNSKFVPLISDERLKLAEIKIAAKINAAKKAVILKILNIPQSKKTG